MNILFYTKEFPPEVGGIETYTYNVANYFAKFGHNVVVAVRRMPGDREFDVSQRFKTVRLMRPVIPPILYRLYTFAAIPLLIKRQAIDFVYLPYWFRFSSIIYHLSKLFGLKYFVTCYGEEVLFDPKRMRHSHRRLLKGYRRAERIFAISEHTKKLLAALGIEDQKVAVVKPGIDVSAAEPAASPIEKLSRDLQLDGKKVVITVSRLVKKKGHDNVLRALSASRERRKGLAYLIIGEGEEEANLKALAKELGLEKEVLFMGRVSDEVLKACYALSDVFIMTTREVDDSKRTEGFGIVYLEANLYGKPVIAGSVGGVGDAVIDGETGILVDPHNVGEISAAIDKLLSDGKLSARLGENGRKRVREEFAWETTARRLETLMLSALGDR
ncbi:MAG: glycosyltransferase family 4 protein [Candidatus Lindowbacteria bacterium]|nr:glycosyltransferase family 4 protein [Candidatus Lindowbacteria bacterium]